MKETYYTQNPKLPYSLHDNVVNKITINEKTVEIFFKDGFVKISDDCPRVDGYIKMTNVDLYSSYICVQNSSENDKKFIGENFSIKRFIDKYKDFEFEIVDEYHGYFQTQYIGYLSILNKRWHKLMSLSICNYDGEVIYITEE